MLQNGAHQTKDKYLTDNGQQIGVIAHPSADHNTGECKSNGKNARRHYIKAVICEEFYQVLRIPKTIKNCKYLKIFKRPNVTQAALDASSQSLSVSP